MRNAVLILSLLCVVHIASAQQQLKNAAKRDQVLERQSGQEQLKRFEAMLRKMRSTTDRAEHMRLMKEIRLFDGPIVLSSEGGGAAGKSSMDSSSDGTSLTALGGATYDVPFGSSMNTIEITVQNRLTEPIDHIAIRPIKAPSWLHFTPSEFTLDRLPAREERTISFQFDIDKIAPIREAQRISLLATSPSGMSWSKEITLSVEPPDRFKLLQNFPNPFNPTTTIPYQLARKGEVTITIYNILGDEITRLVQDSKDAGFYTVTWNASNRSSGIYYVRMSVVDQFGKQSYQAVNKVILMK